MNKLFRRLTTRTSLAFIFCIALLIGGVFLYWLTVVIPVIRAGEQTKADLLITPYTQMIEEALDLDQEEKIEKIMNQLILLKEPETEQPMIILLQITLINGQKIVKQNDIPDAGEISFSVERPLFSSTTQELLGTIRLDYNDFFFKNLIADARQKLLAGLLGAFSLILAVQIFLTYLLRPLSNLVENLKLLGSSKIRSLPSLKGNISTEIMQVDSAINDLLYRLNEAGLKEQKERQLRHEAELKFTRHETELKYLESLRAAKEHTENIIATVPSILIILDDKLGVLSTNKAFEEFRGRFPSSKAEQFIVPLENEIHMAFESGKTAHKEITIIPQDSGLTLTFLAVVLRLDVEGKNGILLSLTDYTKRKETEDQVKRSLKEKELLLSEIHHRVKNNMQIISSLLKLQSGHIEGEEYSEIFRESQNRIKSMALIHEKLYRSENLANIDLKEYIESVAQSLFRSYGTYSRNIDLKMEVQSIRLGIDTAIPCGLIINELVSNSLKYAFPNGKAGEIRISLRSDDKNELELIVCDNGVGIPKELDIGKTKTLGLYLVSILIGDQLQGKIELNRTHGSEFRLCFREVKYKERI